MSDWKELTLTLRYRESALTPGGESRIEPETGVYDEEALAKYEEMLRVMKEEHGFVTFLNLWHFTIPLWADEMGAWENPEFMERWEAPLPAAPGCNSQCLGCISLQPGDCCPASHDRIDFVPTVDELCQVAVPHLTTVDQGIVSFGQG